MQQDAKKDTYNRMTKSSTILGAAVLGILFIAVAYSLTKVKVIEEIKKVETFQVPPTVLPVKNTATDNSLTRAQKFSETAHPARIQNDGQEGFQSYLNPYDYPSPSISQAYEFRLDRKSLLS